MLFAKSSGDYGTIVFFKNRLNRITVTKEPKQNVNATVDFFETVTKGHWIACACEILNVTNLDADISLPTNFKKLSPAEQLLFIQNKVVDKLTLVQSAYQGKDKSVDTNDGAHNYARVLCHFGALVMEFRDAWSEGDGDRVLRCVGSYSCHTFVLQDVLSTP